MRKKMFVLLVSLIMLVSINSVAHSSGEPTEAFLGMYGVEIASVDLDTWDISYFDIPEYWSEAVVEALKYFPEEEKLVFAVTTEPTEDYSYNVGMIDVKTGKVSEFEGIRSYRFRTVKDNKIYLTLEDNEIISYDLSEDKKEVEFRADNIEETQSGIEPIYELDDDFYDIRSYEEKREFSQRDIASKTVVTYDLGEDNSITAA